MTSDKTKPPRIFSDLAHLWRLLSPPDDYAPEAETVDRVLRARLVDEVPRPRLLELGAGGGHTLFHLTDRYEITAVDLSEQMLASCRQLNPGVETIAGDMRSLRLDRTFDAVLIHDAIDYLVDRDEVAATLATGAAHLETGGVILVAPTYVAETFSEHEVEHDQHGDGETTLTYLSYLHHPGPDPSRVENVLVYVIRDASGVTEVVEDRHQHGLFSDATWIELLEGAGFDVTRDWLIPPGEGFGDGTPLFVGVKR